MSNANINLLGILNSVSADHTIARAEQIEITLEDGIKTKIPAELAKYAKGVSSEDIKKFLKIATTPSSKILDDHLFICTKSVDVNYKTGHLYFYDGSQQTLEDITAGGSGSDVSEVSLKVSFREENIDTNTEIRIPFTWTSNNTGYGLVYCLIDGKTFTKLRQKPGTSEWIISSLDRGIHELTMYVVDSDNQFSNKWNFIVSVGSLEITSDFNSDSIYKTEDDIIIPYTIYTNDLDSTLNLLYTIDGVEYQKSVGDSLSSDLVISNLLQGNHVVTLKVESEKDSEIKYSNILSFSVLVITSGVLYAEPIGNTSIVAKERERLSLSTKVAYLESDSFSVYFKIYKLTDGTFIETHETEIPESIWKTGVNMFNVSFNTSGSYKIVEIISVNNISSPVVKEIEYTAEIGKSDLYTIDQITDRSLLLHLTANNKNNTNISRTKWEDQSCKDLLDANIDISKKPVEVSLYNFNYKTNGWLPDENNQTRLVIDSGAYAEIKLMPFIREISNDGFTFEIEYKTKFRKSLTSKVVSCYNGQSGFYIDTDKAVLSHQNSQQTTEIIKKEVESDIVIDHDENGNNIYLKYWVYQQIGPFNVNIPENTRNKITFVINRGKLGNNGEKDFNGYDNPTMNIFVNGVLSASEEISDFTDLVSTKFENNGMKITLGSNNTFGETGYCEIYNVRAYNRALSPVEVLTNYVSDIDDQKEKSDKIVHNKLKNNLVLSSDIPTMYLILNPNDKMNDQNEIYGKITFQPEDNKKAFTSLVGCKLEKDDNYPYKNYNINLYNEINSETGNVKYEYDLGNGFDESSFDLKSNFLDSSSLRNNATSEFISDLGTAVNPAQEFIPSCRTTKYGVPVQLYIVSPVHIDGTIENYEPDLNTKKLLGLYTFDLSNDCNKSMSLFTKDEMLENVNSPEEFNKDYPNWDCLSFEVDAKSDTSSGAFASIDNDDIISDYKLKFSEPLKTEYIGNVKTDTNSVVISGINTDLDGLYEIDFNRNRLLGLKFDLIKTTQDMNETVDGTYEFYYDFAHNEESKGTLVIQNTSAICKTTDSIELYRKYSHLKKLIRWVKESSMSEFKNNFEKHFDLQSMLDYYLLTFVLMITNGLGKKCLWNTWGPVSKKKITSAESGKYSYTQEELREFDNYIWYPQFLDLSSSLGFDKFGNERYDVSEEIVSGVYDVAESVLWKKFAEAFKTEIKNRYCEMREYSLQHATFTVKSLLDHYYDNKIRNISERNYNDNILIKYLNNKNYLYLIHGRGYEYTQYWIEQRLHFLDTYFEYGEEWNKTSVINIEYSNFNSEPITFNLATHYPGYVNVKFGDNQTKRIKILRNEEKQISDFVPSAINQECKIFDAGNIISIGDVSKYTPKYLDLSNMSNLVQLVAGDTDSSNPNLVNIKFADESCLNKLVVEDCSSYYHTLDTSNCSNLEYISTVGSNIKYVKLSSNNSALKQLLLSAATTTIYVKDITSLESIILDGFTNLSTLYIDNCPLLAGYKDTNGKIVSGSIFHLLNDWEPDQSSIDIHLNIYGQLLNSKFLDACARLHRKYGMTERHIYLSGEVEYLGTTLPSEYSKYAKYFPDLKVSYPNITDLSGMFKNYRNIDSIINQIDTTYDPELGLTKHAIRYYWKDAKSDKFSDVLENGLRPIQYYDDDDQNKVALEIKEKIAPFKTIKNASEMFMNCEYIEKILPETFDGIDLVNAVNKNMFANCKHMKYIECPRFKKLDSFIFKDCVSAVIWIPKTVEVIDQYAFLPTEFVNGKHTLILFEKPLSEMTENIPYARDCRFNIIRNPQSGRALRQEIISCPNIKNILIDGSLTETSSTTNAYIEYFMHAAENGNDEGKMIYNVQNYTRDGSNIALNDDKLDFTIWNLSLSNKANRNYWANELNIYEMMYGSMKHFNFNMLKEISIPSFNIINKSTAISSVPDLIKEETNFIKLFNDSIDNIDYSILPELKTIDLIASSDKKVNDWFLYKSELSNIRMQESITSIGNHAFENTKFDEIVLSDNISEIGEYAFANNNIRKIKYSNAMKYIPVGCFANCNLSALSPIVEDITGFSYNITSIKDYAFDNSSKFNIDFVKHLENFTQLESIGNYAFRNIKDINEISITPSIINIGKSAFESDDETMIRWVNNSNINLHICEDAFKGRRINLPELNNSLFIPKTVKVLEKNAFPEVDFVFTDVSSKPIGWSEFMCTYDSIIYNHKSFVLSTDEFGAESLYSILNNNDAIYVKLMNKPTSVKISGTVDNHKIIEISNRAFYDNDDNLNSIIFTPDSNVSKIGNEVFKTHNISNIETIGLTKYLPDSVVEIGHGIPFKETLWFNNLQKDNFVYLNNICLGYSKKDISLENTSESMLNTTEVIYDNAFDGELITHITLPTKLKSIYKYAFANCDKLENIDLSVCEKSLTDIGMFAFMNDSALTEIHYTKNIHHVGNGAFSNCDNIEKVIFDEGCALDNLSYPIPTLSYNLDANEKITEIIIPESMGGFFSPTGIGNIALSALTNIKDITLGKYQLLDLPYDETAKKYLLNLQNHYVNGYYLEYVNGKLIKSPIIIETDSRYFKLPKESYNSDIDIHNIKNGLLSDEDIVRIVMGYNSGATHNIIANRDFVVRASASKYRILFGNRVSIKESK